MFNTLGYIGKTLNEYNILWGVGASVLLNQYGIIDKPNDIDILVATKDIEKADEILKSMGEKQLWEKSGTYSTKYFYEYIINGFDIDVLSGMRINHDSGVFEYIFDINSISEIKKINGVDIPLTSLEDWYVIYQVIPNREAKVKLIEDYILLNGIKKPMLLERSLKCNLPIGVKEKIERLLSL